MSVDTIVQLFHNPKAGTARLSREKLLDVLAAEGWSCNYASVKADDWDIQPEATIVIIAGGDGTVRKVCKKIFEQNLHPVIALLPVGTSNNIAETLQIKGDLETIIRRWQLGNANTIRFDSGYLANASCNSFFVESAGIGLFPEMVKNVGNKKTKKNRSASEKQEDSLAALHETSINYKPQYCYLNIDGKDYSDEYNLVEVMNIAFIGPNVLLNPNASINDGFLDVVISRSHEKERTIDYLHNKLKNGIDECPLQVIRGKHVQMKWSGKDIHIDDELVQVKPGSLTEITAKNDFFTFFHAGSGE